MYSEECTHCGVRYLVFHADSIPAGVEFTWVREDEEEEDVAAPRMMCGYLKRVFVPCQRSEWNGSFNPETLTRYNPTSQTTSYLVTRTVNGILYPRLTTLVVAVDGACRGNGTSSAHAGIGVFFGPDSRYNCCGRLPPDLRQSSNQAEILSSLIALHKIETEILAQSSPRIKQVVLITDSEFVIKSMSEYVWRWLKNGFTTSKRTEVRNASLLLALHRMIERFEEELDVDVRFWRVDRQFNRDADGLANRALDAGEELYLDVGVCDQCVSSIPVPKTCPHV